MQGVSRFAGVMRWGSAALLCLAAAAWSAEGEEIPCADDVSYQELPSLYFIADASFDHPQRSNFGMSDVSGWVEAEWNHEQLRFNHLAPGVGLAFDLLFVKFEVLDDNGEVIRQFSADIPSSNECFLLSIFPGGSTRWFDLSKNLEGLPQRSRVRVRVFVPAS